MSKGCEGLFLSPCCAVRLFLFLADADSPPRFTRTPEDQTGVQGGVASFVCQATGDPQPKIVWNKKGKKVSNQRFEVIEFDDGSGSVLRIQPLRTPRDEAVYECHASNSAGEITASTKLTVLREDQLPSGFPTIDMGPQLKVVERSRTATMLCAASGNPDPEITWFKDFLPVNTSNNNGRIKQLRSAPVLFLWSRKPVIFVLVHPTFLLLFHTVVAGCVPQLPLSAAAVGPTLEPKPLFLWLDNQLSGFFTDNNLLASVPMFVLSLWLYHPLPAYTPYLTFIL
ncbi:receptor-type tyrosine-protein phosphatase S-like isoform X15 [Solea senegalensis]|uniref:Receptor-type tyrosine-protein phosphatase S-like isoform X15 n=1 Tax=Solea senegalensis TaxID=28829 RepID=A0AAV6QDU9_SOLSE|nr:receptor-type tyrosine-protein phosphatase S-like isoform X15 [Solea senegalensis]